VNRAVALLAVTVVLAGCQSVEQLRALAPQQTDYTICESLVTGHPGMRQVAAEEMQRRRLDCSPYQASIGMRQQQSAAQTATGLQLLQMSQPQPVMPLMRPPLSCSSRNVMGTIYTDCN
jgi:nitrous oxide reductase accessory protein NosL